MTGSAAVTVVWGSSAGEFPFVPARITALEVDVVAAPGERVPVPPGPCTVRIDVPGYAPYTVAVEVSADDDRLVQLRPDRLHRHRETGESERLPRGLSITAVPWSPPVLPSPGLPGLVMRARTDTVGLTAGAGSPTSWAVELVGRRTPRRLLVVPPVLTGDDAILLWHRSGNHVRRPRIEPADDGGQLLMNYLLNGQYTLAAAAARTLERFRGEQDPLSWVTPSYTQLLIGYAFALDQDSERLLAWCERTSATTELGSDGLVLAAEAAWQHNDPVLARRLLATAVNRPLPAIALGAELALDRATSLVLLRDRPSFPNRVPIRPKSAKESLGPDPDIDRAVMAVSNNWTRTLTRADNGSLSLSVAQTGRMSPDLEQAPWPDRARWLLNYLVSRWRYRRLRGRRISFTFAKELRMPRYAGITEIEEVQIRNSSLRSYRSAVVAAALLFVVGITVVLSNESRWRIGAIGWFAIGTLLATTFLAIGAYAAASVYRAQMFAAENRARIAAAQAREFHEAAMKGRALAAVLKADTAGAAFESSEAHTVCLRHWAIAEQLEILDRIEAHTEHLKLDLP